MVTNKFLQQMIGLILAVLLLTGCGRAPTEPALDVTPIPPTDTPSPSATPAAAGPQAGATRVWEKDGAVMVYVPAGMFVMGSTDDDPEADDDEFPQHDVILDGFWIDRTEVTNGRYEQCVTAGACDAPSETGSYARDAYYGNSRFADYPVIWVSWHDAMDYCEWAGKRLPTEAEWEKAARGVDGRKYPWGNSSPDGTLANYGENEDDTVKVGSYPEGASPYGALDMAGNVWEWVADWYGVDYYAASSQQNPMGPGPGSLKERVVRGGSWLYPQRRIRAAYRNSRDPGFREGNFGFRCAFSP
jgi:formylglycine-generating enzyme required for sulfatase activity